MKYVIVADGDIPMVAVFGEMLDHRRMAHAALRSLNGQGRLVGAGFVTLRDGEPYGRSESLDRGPGPNDVLTLRAFLEVT